MPESKNPWWWVWVQDERARYLPAPTAYHAAVGYADEMKVPFGTSVHVAPASEVFVVGFVAGQEAQGGR